MKKEPKYKNGIKMDCKTCEFYTHLRRHCAILDPCIRYCEWKWDGKTYGVGNIHDSRL